METINRVSIIQLIANPQKYDGKYIRVKGFTIVAFEGNAIYLSSLDAENAIIENSLWLSLNKNQIEEFQKNSKHYCIVEGKFKYGRIGHMGMYSGAIQKITRFEIWK